MEPTTKPSNNRAKIIIISAGIVLASAGITIYGLSAYNNGLWPFPVKKDSSKGLDNTKTVVEGKLDRKPLVREYTQGDVLNVRPNIPSTTQGDCLLTLKNNENKYEYRNSTVGTDGILGCLEFNIGLGDVEPGSYDMTIEFESDSESSIIREKVIVK